MAGTRCKRAPGSSGPAHTRARVGRTFLYQKSELTAIAKRDRSRHRLAVAGFIVLGLAFVLQLVAQLVR